MPMSEVSRILSQIESGDPSSAEQLLPLVYEELRKLAAAKLAQEKPGQTLQATALVHEAYLRLLGNERDQSWDGRGHFFAAAGEAMRRVLVEQARRRRAVKRGGEVKRDELCESAIAAPHPVEELLVVDEVLDELAEVDPVAANLVKLRFYAGLNTRETAAALGISVRSAHNVWTYARSWLHQRISRQR
jgi:RNA polymerase sigma factor (TIGR02999 family)